MPSVTTIPSISGGKIRLIVDGGWSAAADAALRTQAFDVLELQRGEYTDLQPLVAHADRISAIWINALCKRTDGLEALENLTRLQLGFPADQHFQFTALPLLRSVDLEHWKPYYRKSLFKCSGLRALQIVGYDKSDCREFSVFQHLCRFSLVQPKCVSLDGLVECGALKELVVSHAKTLSDVSEVWKMTSLERLEMREKLPLVTNVSEVSRLTNLVTLDLRGVAATLSTIDWLENLDRLEVALLPKVESVNWTAAFASKRLRKLLVQFATRPSLSAEEIAAFACSRGLSPVSTRFFGSQKSPSLLMDLA